MEKLFRVLSRYDNYLDEGAIDSLLNKLPNTSILGTIVYEIKIPNLIKEMFIKNKTIFCGGKYGEHSLEEIYDCYMSLVYSKNIIITATHIEHATRHTYTGYTTNIIEDVFLETDDGTICIPNISKLQELEILLSQYVFRTINFLSTKPIHRIIGLYNMYDNNQMINITTDSVLLGYDRDYLLIVSFYEKMMNLIEG